MPDELAIKLRHLLADLAGRGRLAVAFSGGVDSAFLLWAARRALPPADLLALTAQGPLFPRRESREAAELAEALGVSRLVLDFEALAVPLVAANPPDRCYHCKRALLERLTAAARERGFDLVADGGNLDDLDDFRPGARAVRELGIVSPLKEAGLTKTDIRRLSAENGLPTWDKPAFACLASRVPYGQALTRETLARVERAEDFLLALGFREVRVRCHDQVARLEVGADERSRFFDLNLMDRVHRELTALGFAFVALDLAGYQTGGLNRAVDQATRNKYNQR